MGEYLFVYGTLRKHGKRYWHQKLLKNASYISGAIYQGKLYRIRTYPGTIPSKQSKDFVVGEVYQLHNSKAVFSWLDKYEVCLPQKNAEYTRRKDNVKLTSGKTMTVWLYLYHRRICGLTPIRSGNFIKHRMT